MLVNLLPDIRRPVLVKIVRIFHKEHIGGAKFELAALFRSDRNRVALALQ